MTTRRRLAFVAVAVVVLPVISACSEGAELDEPVETATLPPTTALVINYLDVAGLPFCQVAEDVAPAIQVFSDPSSNYGDQDTVADTYVEALTAFDALRQVATREIVDDLGLLTRTVKDAVHAAVDVNWDLTMITDDAGSGVRSDDMVKALAHLRVYTQQRCGIDVVGIEPPITAGPKETPEERQRRVIEETFPALADEQVACVGRGLPIDFDPEDPNLDENLVPNALKACGINPDQPGAPTTSTTSTSEPEPGDTTG